MTNTVLPFILTLLVVCGVIWLIRQQRLREKYAVLWVLVGVMVLVLAGFPQLLGWAAEFTGFAVPSNLLFMLAIFLLLGVCLHLSLEISVVEDETRALAEEAAILRAQLDRLEADVAALKTGHSKVEPPQPGIPGRFSPEDHR